MLKRFHNSKLFRNLLFLPLIVLGVISHLTSNSQGDSKVDSLLNELKKSKHDTIKVFNLNAISEQFWKTLDYSQALKYAEEALSLSEKINFKKGMANSYQKIGLMHHEQGHSSLALDNYLIALNIRKEIRDEKGIAQSYNSIGCLYTYQDNYQAAIDNHLLAIALREQIKDKEGLATSYLNIGVAYYKQYKYDEAMKYYLTSLEISKEINDTTLISYNYSNIGNVYEDQGYYHEALKYNLNSLKLKEEIGDKKGIAGSYVNIAIIYIQFGNYHEAVNYYLAALKISEVLENKNLISYCYNGIADAYMNQGNYVEALKYTLESLKIKEKINDPFGMAASYLAIGNIYSFMNNDKEALINYSKSVKLNEIIGDKSIIVASYQNMGSIYKGQGNFTLALENYLASKMICEDIGDNVGIANAYILIGYIYEKQNNYTDALNCYSSALKIYNDLGVKQGVVSAYINLGYLNMALNNLDESKIYFNDALSLSIDLGTKYQIRDAYNGLSKLDSTMGNHLQGLEHYKLYTLYKDSLLNETNSKMIEQMKMSYETEKKDNEIQKLESEKEINLLQFTVQQKSLKSIQTEKDKIFVENLFNLQRADLLANEKRLQQLEIAKNQSDFAAQKAETNRKQDQLVLLSKEGMIQKLEVKKQTLLKNYFLAGLFLFGLLSFFVYNNYRTRQKLKLQTLRNKIASDLHDDVGSTLSSISIFSQMAQEQSKDVLPLLSTIEESSRKMLDAMADIVWTIHPENDQFEKIILRMRSFAFELLGAKNIKFQFIADEDISKIKLPMEVRKNLYLIFKEATNNLVKYAEADKAIFSLKSEKEYLTMLIRDNGKGFDPEQSTQGNGIRNMKKRAEEIGAKLMIDSIPGSGTTIQLKVAV